MKDARKKLKARIEKDKFPESLTISTQEFKGEVGFDRNFLLIAKLEYALLSLNYIFMRELYFSAKYASCTMAHLHYCHWILVGNGHSWKPTEI